MASAPSSRVTGWSSRSRLAVMAVARPRRSARSEASGATGDPVGGRGDRRPPGRLPVSHPVTTTDRPTCDRELDAAEVPPTLGCALVSEDLTGRRLGHYRIDGVLGRGGMSVLYKGTDVRLGRKVALKVIA